ncbi:MAG: hypothetical protein R3279_09385 [Putridiphycobacter sp.]|nr:hypothetical protein [Putridiphycobacter sp.]
MKNQRSIQRIAVLLLISFLMSGCKYYKIKTHQPANDPIAHILSKESISSNYRYITPHYFLHVGEQFWTIEGVTINDKLITGTKLTPVDSIYSHYYERALNRKFLVPSSDLGYINQVHIFVDEFALDEASMVSIAIKDVTKVDMMKKDNFATGASVILTAVAAGTVALGVFLAIACNCPHTYVFDGEQYHYNNTLFTGATSESLERNDYKLLPDYFPTANLYQLMIKNEQHEIHHTNLLELIVVTHADHTRILTDQRGEVYTVSEEFRPLSATTDNGVDVAQLVGYEDGYGYEFDQNGSEDFANVYATFKAPANKASVKLLIKAKNTEWSGVVNKEFSQLFGNKYDEWNKKANKRSAEEVESYRNSVGINLMVAVKQNDQWIDVETIHLIGDVSFNTLVVNLQEQYITSETIEIRLRSGFKFWSVDYIAMDVTAPENVKVQRLQPAVAIQNNQLDVKDALAGNDGVYMVHPNNTDSTIVTFKSLETNENGSRTLFLHSKGYYLIMDEFEGRPNRAALAKFKDPHELTRYSKELYGLYKDYYTNRIK